MHEQTRCMQIKYLADARIPTEKAHGFSMTKMCSEFAARGVDVELVIPPRSRKEHGSVFSYYDLPETFAVRQLRIPDAYRIAIIPRKLAFYLQAVLYLLAVVFLYGLRPGKQYVVYTRHAHVAYVMSFFCTVYWESNDIFSEKKSAWLARIVRCVSGLIVVNEILQQKYMETYGVPKERIVVARCAADVARFDAEQRTQSELRAALSLPTNAFIIGYIGKFHTNNQEKGVEFLVQSLGSIADTDVHLCCVGGEQKDIDRVSALAKTHGVEDRVHLIQHVGRADVVAYMKSFDVVAMPFPWTYHYAYRMSPIKMFEYMAAQRPIIATDLPTITEVLRHKESAFIIAPNSAEEFVQAVRTLKENQDLCTRMSAQAYEDVAQFTWKRRAQRVHEYICSDQS